MVADVRDFRRVVVTGQIVRPEGSLVVPLGDAPVVDTTGAGDTFVAALVAALAEGLEPAECGRRAAAAAGRTVRHPGGRPRLG